METGKILLIEDNREEAAGLVSLLEKSHYSVSCACTGRDGIKKAEEKKFDLVILDLLLPDMKGEAVCSLLKKRRALRDIPVMVLTVKDGIEDIEELFERGADEYIIKPPRTDYLLDKVEAYIAKKRP